MATVAVVVVHASYWTGRSTEVAFAVWPDVTLLARFCVPAFVVLGGVVLAYRYPDGTGPGFAARRARRSVVPWLAWAPVAFLVGLLLGQVGTSPGAVWQWWAGGGGHLYYLVLVPQLYLLFVLWPRHDRAAVAVTAVAVAAQVALEAVRLVLPRDRGLASAVLLWHGYELAPFWAGYFALGVLAGRRWSRTSGGAGTRSGAAAAALVPVTGAVLVAGGVMGSANASFLQGTGAFLRPLVLPFTLAVCWAALALLPAVTARIPRLRGAVDVISRHSLGVYIVHPFLLTAVGRTLGPMLGGSLPVSAAGLLLAVGLTVVAALCVVRLLVALPLARTLGEARSPLRRRPAEVELVGRRAGAGEPMATATRIG